METGGQRFKFRIRRIEQSEKIRKRGTKKNSRHQSRIEIVCKSKIKKKKNFSINFLSPSIITIVVPKAERIQNFGYKKV